MNAVIDKNSVSSVYSGRAHRCCCGCAGKHTYASRHRKWASVNRGYKVTDDEVNDRVVTSVLNTIEKLAREGHAMDICLPSHVSITVGKRLYIAYFVGAVD